MRWLRNLLLGIGVLAALMGLVWIGQGTGLFPYPPSSPMIDQMPWTYRGFALLMGGIAVCAVSRRV
jgi:hypothetical protein